MNPKISATLLSACAVVLLSACDGSSGSSEPLPTATPTATPTAPPQTPAGFTQKNVQWTFDLPAKDVALCYDFDAQQAVACSGEAWDLKVLGGQSSPTFWTNSGVSGSGKGGAFGGPFDHQWSTLSTWDSALLDPEGGAIPQQAFTTDQPSGVFTGSNAIGSAAFEYDLDGSRQLFPSYRVFLITTDSSNASATQGDDHKVYALQVIGYYGGTGGTTSGFPTLRWIDRSVPDDVRTRQYDASTEKVYINLDSGDSVGADGDWQIALDRFNVSLNGGDSGSGSVAGFVAATPAGLYNEDGTPNVASLMAARPEDSLALLKMGPLDEPASARAWVRDVNHSALNPAYRGNFPGALQFGWYNYHPTAEVAAEAGLPAAHMLKATPEGAALLRSGEGNSYARLHLTDIRYDAPQGEQSPASTPQHWTLVFDVQPAPVN